MSTNTPSTPLHPLLATAAVSVIVASATGVAYMAGLLPGKQPPPSQPTVVAAAPTPAPVAPLSAPVPAPVVNTTAPVTTPPSSPAPVVAGVSEPTKPVFKKVVSASHHESHKPVVHKKVVDDQPADVSRTEEHDSAPPPPVCYSCGTVVAVTPVVTESQPSGLGAVSGAIIGGVIGHQFGGGHGKQAMTAAGVIGGAMAGNQIEKTQRTVSSYQVTVQMDDGSSRSFDFKIDPKFHSGEHVKVDGSQLLHAY